MGWDETKVKSKTRTDIFYLEDDEASDRGILRQGSNAGQEGIKVTNDVFVSGEQNRAAQLKLQQN